MTTDLCKGGCLCGDVRYEVSGGVPGGSVCHCAQCRKQSGHVWASAVVPQENLRISGPVTWFAASDAAKRGFCPRCGSFLFWKHKDENTISFSLGSLDDGAGIVLEKHIFVASKGDYYDISDQLPQVP